MVAAKNAATSRCLRWVSSPQTASESPPFCPPTERRPDTRDRHRADRRVADAAANRASGVRWCRGGGAKLAGECGDARLGTPQDQGMDVVSALIGVDRLEVHHVADHVVLVRDAVAAMHVAGGAGDVERLAAIVALQDRDHFGGVAARILEPPEAQARVQTKGDFGLHVDELLLDQLVGGERAAELPALERIVARGVPAELGGAERPPSYPIARAVEAGERAAQPFDLRQQILLRDEHFV